MPELTRLRKDGGRLQRALRRWALLVALPACQPQPDQLKTASVPPVGHYEGSIGPGGRGGVRAALDIRHPSPGHYEAELTVPAVPTLDFVADTIRFGHDRLRLVRPARPGQTLTLTREGDFWRGRLALDSAVVPVILLKRGTPTPRPYRVEQAPQANGPAWLFAPADTGTPGAALALLPDAATAPTAAIWADALAREGITVLLLPAVDSATGPAEIPRLQAALRLLRGTAGADTANTGAWAVGGRAAALTSALVDPGSPRVAFLIAQNTAVGPTERAALRELRRRGLPVLGLYGGPGAGPRAAAWRTALGGRRGGAVRAYRATGPDLLVPGGLSPAFGPGLPGAVVEWLRGR